MHRFLNLIDSNNREPDATSGGRELPVMGQQQVDSLDVSYGERRGQMNRVKSSHGRWETLSRSL